jgi:hypothetical protein
MSNSDQQRGARRIRLALPVRITYWDEESQPCVEMACTYDISSRGAKLMNLQCAKQVGDVVVVERGRTKIFCRVAWVGKPGSPSGGHVGIQSVETDKQMWEAELRPLLLSFEAVPSAKTSSARNLAAGEQRVRRRFTALGSADLEKIEGARSRVVGSVRNISESGCLISSEQVFAPGTDVEVALTIGNYDLKLRGTVRHAGLGPGLGIQFREIRKGDRECLQHLLRKLEDNKPAVSTEASHAASS